MSYLFAINRAHRTVSSRWSVPASLVLGTAGIYLSGLADAPQYPLRDEMYFAVTAHSVATTGLDPRGHLLPIYFPIGPADRPLMWFQPLLMYAIAAVLQVLPFDLLTVRLPMALAGVANVLLIYFTALALLRRRLPAVTAAVLLATAPAHFLFSRSATDYLLPVPFILGWLWCVIRYERTGQRSTLICGALLLGIGLYTLIAAYILMPIYALLTCGVLWLKRSPVSHFAAVAAGVLGPALLGIAFVLAHPDLVADVMSRYEPAARGTGGGHVRGFMVTRLSNLGVYSSFWNPELLVINGGEMLTGAAGVFALPTLGLVFVGAARAVVARNPMAWLLLAGLVTAPIPASLVNEPGAIRRALEMLPFAALLAAYGIDWIWSSSSLVRRVVFVSVCLAMVMLSADYRPQLPLAQAYIRAATLPVLIVALAMVLGRFGFAVSPSSPAAIVMSGVVAIGFVYFYVDFAFVRRVGPIPATLVLWLFRGIAAAAVAILAWLLANMLPGQDRRRATTLMAAMIALEVGYFYVDRSTVFVVRLAHVAIVAAATFAIGWHLRRMVIAPQRLGQVAASMVIAIAAIQFTGFYWDYGHEYRTRRASAHEGSVLLAFDAVLDRVDLDVVPAIYLANAMERADVRDLFWKFAVLRHDRADLLARTVSEPGRAIDRDRVDGLPARSIVVTGAADADAKTLVDAGRLRVEQIVRAADGMPVAWILLKTKM